MLGGGVSWRAWRGGEGGGGGGRRGVITRGPGRCGVVEGDVGEGAGVGGVEVDLEVGLVGCGGDGNAGTRRDLGADGGSVHPEGCLGVARDGQPGVGIGVKDVDAPPGSGAGHHGGSEAGGRGGRDADEAILILPLAREGYADADELDDLVGGVKVVRANLGRLGVSVYPA